MVERLSGEYNRGYTKAIMDMQEVFDYVNDDLVGHKKRMNYKLAKELLGCCLTNRERLRESMNGFIRWNGKDNKFEFFEPGKKS